MMLIDNTFELSIPTHIQFTLYKFDYIDSLIISRVKNECKNWSDEIDVYSVDIDSFRAAINGNKRLKMEIEKAKIYGLSQSPDIKPNSIYFLYSIMERLVNLEFLTFKVSYDKKFSRMVKVESHKHVQSFYFKINEGVFDLTKVYDREQLDIINKRIIEFGMMPNKYLERSPYFYMKANALVDLLGSLEMDGILETFELLDHIDSKLEEDDPVLTVITDYTSY